MKIYSSIVTIAGTLFLAGCTEQDEQQAQSIFQAFGVTDLVSQASSPAPAVVAYVEPEAVPEPPKQVWDCWSEWHRGGDYGSQGLWVG